MFTAFGVLFVQINGLNFVDVNATIVAIALVVRKPLILNQTFRGVKRTKFSLRLGSFVLD